MSDFEDAIVNFCRLQGRLDVCMLEVMLEICKKVYENDPKKIEEYELALSKYKMMFEQKKN